MMEQGTAEWRLERVGMITASRIKDVMATIKSGEAASRRDYRMQLAVERISGLPTEGFVSADMRWGTEQEPLARLAYSLHTGFDVEEVGFVKHPAIRNSGCSPDGLIGDDGMVEIKNGKTATHVEWAVAGIVPPEHVPQMQWQMACTGRTWTDFVSFDSRMPDGMQLFVRRLYRDDDHIRKIAAEVIKLDAEVEETIVKLSGVKWA